MLENSIRRLEIIDFDGGSKAMPNKYSHTKKNMDEFGTSNAFKISKGIHQNLKLN